MRVSTPTFPSLNAKDCGVLTKCAITIGIPSGCLLIACVAVAESTEETDEVILWTFFFLQISISGSLSFQ